MNKKSYRLNFSWVGFGLTRNPSIPTLLSFFFHHNYLTLLMM